MEAIKLVAQANELLKKYLVENDIDNDGMLAEAYSLLEQAIEKMTENMK